jgi:hypothetical protein
MRRPAPDVGLGARTPVSQLTVATGQFASLGRVECLRAWTLSEADLGAAKWESGSELNR